MRKVSPRFVFAQTPRWCLKIGVVLDFMRFQINAAIMFTSTGAEEWESRTRQTLLQRTKPNVRVARSCKWLLLVYSVGQLLVGSLLDALAISMLPLLQPKNSYICALRYWVVPSCFIFWQIFECWVLGFWAFWSRDARQHLPSLWSLLLEVSHWMELVLNSNLF